MNIEVNIFAILLAAVASMMVGFIYYNPKVFGKPWMKEMGYNRKDLQKEQSKMSMLYGVSFVLALLTAYILTHIMEFSLKFYGNPVVATGLTSGFFAWLGFVMPVQATDQIFGKKNFKLFLLNTGYQLASLLVMGIVLGLIR